MVWEKVNYYDGLFTTVFCFSNTTPDIVQIKIGFPIKSYASDILFDEFPEGGVGYQDAILKMIQKELNFQSFIDGISFPRKLYLIEEKSQNKKDLKGYDYLFLGETIFSPYQSVIVSNTYYQKPEHSSANWGVDSYTVIYVLKTGSSWKDPIKKSGITIYFPFYANPLNEEKQMYYTFLGCYGFKSKNYFYKITPNPDKLIKTKLGYKAEWKKLNFSPNENIEIIWGYTLRESGKYAGDDPIFPVINNMIEKSNPNLFKKKCPEYFKEFQDEERFYSYITALGLGIIGGYGDSILSDYGKLYKESIIRFVINGFNAVNGYNFKTKLWREFFKNFDWYIPENDETMFSVSEKKLVDELLKRIEK